MMYSSKLPREYKFTKYVDDIDHGIRYDLHFKGKNIAYALVIPMRSEKRKEIALKEKPEFQIVDGPFLEGVVISEEHQHKGLAIYLIKKIEGNYKGQTIRLKAEPYKSKTLSVKRLVKFYEYLGYKVYDKPDRMMKKIKRATL